MNKKPKQALPLLPKSIIEHYSKYRNKISIIKPQIIMGTRFEIDDTFEIIDSIGQGAYGIVVAAQDKTNPDTDNNLIAIKKIEKAFEHKIFAKRTLRELKILRLLNHENVQKKKQVVNIQTILQPKSREEFEDIYVVSELMETDLASIIKSPQSLTEEHCQFFLYQILRGMKYIHSAKILHRDLKPRNLLVNSNCDLKICDFGLSRACLQEVKISAGVMTDYVATRWYRAPELLLCWQEYSTSVDVWSVGCIFAELLRRKPFLPGTDSFILISLKQQLAKNQIELIFDLIGTPNEEEINSIPREKSRKFVKALKKRQPRNFEQIFPKASPQGSFYKNYSKQQQQALDLLKKFFIFSPEKRITIEEALKHPYLAALHCLDDEPTTTSVNKLEFEFEMYSLTLEQLKDMIYEEILLYHYPDFKKDYDEKTKKNVSLMKHILSNDNSQLAEKDSDDEYDSDF